MSEPKHTPLPWYADGPEVLGIDGNGDFGYHVATAWNSPGGPEPDEAHANAELIVRAVNAHADLLAALESLLGEYESLWSEATDDQHGEPNAPAYEQAKAAVTKARGA
jgi:hypothetical protein